jgi:hypothetical protein
MREKGLSPFISTTLIILIGLVGITLVLSLVKPSLDKTKDSAVINEALQNLNLVGDTIKEIVSEGESAKTTISLSVSEGRYEIDPVCDCFNFSYTMKAGLDISGYKNGINITRSGDKIYLFLTYSNIDIQGSEHFSKGDNSISIKHNGLNTTNNHPIIYIGK